MPIQSLQTAHIGRRFALGLAASAAWPTAVGYRLVMPAAKSPTPEETADARRMLLTGLAQDVPLPDLIGELAPLHPRNNTFPGEVFLRLATDALAWSGAGPPTRCR
jgi:hypothetical protein